MEGPIREEGKCLLCGKPAKLREFSPDGPADFFCSINHYRINRDYFSARRIGWRAGPLEEYNPNK